MKFWDKFHLCCSENGKIARGEAECNFAILTTTLVKFTPNFTPSHAITYTNNIIVKYHDIIIIKLNIMIYKIKYHDI